MSRPRPHRSAGGRSPPAAHDGVEGIPQQDVNILVSVIPTRFSAGHQLAIREDIDVYRKDSALMVPVCVHSLSSLSSPHSAVPEGCGG